MLSDNFSKEGGFPMNPKQTFYEHQANTIIANLKKRQMDGFYCPTREDAVKKAMELVASGDSVSCRLHDTFRIRYHGCVKRP